MTAVNRIRRAQLWVSLLALAMGALGLWQAWGLGFTDDRGALVGWPSLELATVSFNPLGALVTLALGFLAVVAVVVGARILLLAATAGFAALAVLSLVQASGDPGWLGLRGGSSFSLYVALAVGLFVLDRGERAALAIGA
ncbi:MAG: hypothetical protein IPM45_09265 [Acidimicrobiales bacterium]|nr:hypothetical protein [Acidimicrobiales bacterium]